jgi:hypothetical protein
MTAWDRLIRVMVFILLGGYLVGEVYFHLVCGYPWPG